MTLLAFFPFTLTTYIHTCMHTYESAHARTHTREKNSLFVSVGEQIVSVLLHGIFFFPKDVIN